MVTESGKAWRKHFTTEEIRALRTVSNWRGAWTLFVNHGLVAAAMTMVAFWPNVLTVLLALMVIGTRQLGFAVVMHEAAHHTLFTNRALNDWCGDWFGAYPIYLSSRMYRAHHLDHHAKTWTDQDPDLALAKAFPVSAASMTRKVLRDLLGMTGIKQVVGTTYVVMAHLFGREVTTGALPLKLDKTECIKMLFGTVVTNGMLFAFLWFIGQPMLYLLWAGAYLTTNKLATRIRSIAEHAIVSDPADPLQNARTVRARWWERLFVAPNLVQYHLEHHLVMTVPHYNLPRFHKLMRERGLLDGANTADGYPSVLRAAVL